MPKPVSLSFKVGLENSETVWQHSQDQLCKKHKELTNRAIDGTDIDDTLPMQNDSLINVDVSPTDATTESFDVENGK